MRAAVTARREAALACLAGLLLAAGLTWPVLAHPRSTVPLDVGDPLLQAWQLAWGAHALTHAPLHAFDSNTFWPLPQTLAFSDSLLGWAPLGVLFGEGTGAALLRYNVIFVLTYALAFAGAYVLARQLGTRWPAAALAGLGYAFAPWHFAQQGHLQVLSDGGIPLALALLARGHGYGRAARGPVRPGLVVAGWAAAAWQVSLGFGLGLAFGYLLGVLSLIHVVAWLLNRPRQQPTRALVLAEAGGLAVFLLVAAVFARPYLQVAGEHPESRRTVADLQLFSPPLSGFVTTPDTSWLWGDAQAGLRARLSFRAEMTLAPGGALVVLAMTGTLIGRWPRRRRVGLAVGSVVLLLLAMGTRLAGGRFSYLLLFDHVPGWQGVRTPGRLVVPLTLGLALLAGAGVDRLRELVGTGPYARARSALLAAGALLVVGLEVLGSTPTPTAPPLPAALTATRGPVLVLPSDAIHDSWAMFWSSAGFPALANGNSGFTPRELDQLRTGVAAFPDPASVALLRRRGIREVVLLPAYADGSSWQGAEAKPVDGLPLERRVEGEAVVFRLGR